MKTLIVLCSLATIVIALPTPLLENVAGIESLLENDKHNKLREKKSVLQYTVQELPLENGMENTQSRHSLKTSSSDKSKAGNKKPIIIKKKFGYHVYRDSEEERTHAEPDEICRKQFKVKLCDDKFSVHSPNKPKSVILDDSHEIISDKEMGKSLKMAKEAVEKLERGLKQMEHMSAKKRDSTENFESGTTLKQDIEMAKNALDDIQKSMGNLESIEFQLNDPTTQNLESMNQWKESIDNIHRNVETAKNIEDAFDFSKQDLHNSEIINTPKMSQDEHTTQPTTLSQTVLKDNNIDINHDMKLKTSRTNNEQNINVDDDLFVSPTDHKESIMKLHSDSLTSENVFDTKALDDQDMKKLKLNTNDHLLKKSSEVLPQDSELKNVKTVSIQELNATPTGSVTSPTLKENDEKKENCGSEGENNDINKLTKDKNVNSLTSAAKNTESTVIKEDSHNESGTEQKTNEFLGKKSFNSDNFSSKITLLKENEAKNDDQIMPTHLDFTESKMHARENTINNKNSDLTENSFKSQVPQVNHQNIQISSMTADGPGDDQYISSEFSSTRLAENQNMKHLDNENHETKDFHLKHFTEEKDHSSSRMNKDLKMDEQLNDFHESFMRLAQEKQMNDFLFQQYKNAELMHAQMHQNHNIGSHLHENRNSHDFSSMYQLSPNNIIPTDYSTHHLKNALEFNNDYMVPTISKMNGLRNDESSLSGLSSLRHAESQNNENMAHEMAESQNIKDPLLTERWAQEKQRKDSHAFKAVSELHNDLTTPHKTHDFHNDQYAHKEHIHMRIPDDQSLGQLFTDSHETHDPHSMRWAQEKQNGYDLPQMHDHEHELYNEPQLNAHMHELMPTNRFNNHFDLDNNHNGYTMRSRMPDHFHIVQHAKSSDMDSAMQPSMHIPMRESNMQLGHLHNHHGMARTSYAPSQSSVGPTSGAVGVFSTANTGSGCGIPLLVSCSPSIVSGNLSRAQPIGTSASAYRTGDNLMYYRKRDANKIEGKQNTKIQKAQIPSTQ